MENILRPTELEPLKIMLFLVLHMFISVYLCMGYVHMSTGAFRGQKKELDTLKMELQGVLRCPALVLGTSLNTELFLQVQELDTLKW